MPVLPIAEWKPDTGPLEGGTSIAHNVFPASAGSYGPLQELVPQVTGGAIGTPAYIAGAATGENLVDGSSQTFIIPGGTNKIAQLVGGTFVAVNTNITTLTDIWAFTQFKNLMTAVSPNNGLWSQQLSSPGSAFVNLSGPAPLAPTGLFSATVNDFLMLGRTFDTVSGGASYRIWWSAIGDPTNWPTPGSTAAQQVQSDYNDFLSDRGVVNGLCGQIANADGLVFFERGVQRITYVGPPAIFSFSSVPNAPGTNASLSIIRNKESAFYFGQDGFVMTDGASTMPIGVGKVDRFTLDRWNGLLTDFRGAWNDRLKCAMWALSSAAKYGGVAHVFDTLLIYSPYFSKWTICNLKFNCMWQGAYGPTGETAQNLSLPGYVDGNFRFALMAGDLPTFPVTGGNLAATVSTVEQQPVAGKRVYIKNARPLTDGGAPTVVINYRDALTSPQVTGPTVAMTSTGSCPQRINARFAQAVVSQPADAVWQYIEGVDVEGQPGGMR